MAPVVHGLEDKYGEYLSFSYLDIDDPNTAALQQEVGYDYRWRPYIMLLTSSGEAHRIFIGVIPGQDIEIALQELLKVEGLIE